MRYVDPNQCSGDNVYFQYLCRLTITFPEDKIDEYRHFKNSLINDEIQPTYYWDIRSNKVKNGQRKIKVIIGNETTSMHENEKDLAKKIDAEYYYKRVLILIERFTFDNNDFEIKLSKPRVR